MVSVKRNFLYSSILTISGYIFPIITYPYVSRILGVENIGLCNFIDSIINYFTLFSSMGVGIVGVREIARAKGNRQMLDNVYSNLFFLNALSTIIALATLVVFTLCIPKLWADREMMAIGGVRLLFNFLLVEWFFKGIEDFKFITVRSVFIKCLYVIAVFVFVRKADDYQKYYVLITLMVVANALVNIWYSRLKVRLKFSNISFKPYIKPFFILGIYILLTSMYTSFNVTFLGFTSGETEVGYYTTATKLYAILLGLFTAFTGVMLPRMSALVAEGKIDEFKSMVNRSVTVLTTFSTPLVCFSFVMAPQIIRIISGAGYEGAITPMRIVIPLILIIGYEQILVIQTLMPLKADKYILHNSLIGASVGFILNITIVPYLHSVGSSIVWISSEIVVLVCAQFAVYKSISLSFPWRDFGTSIIGHLPLAVLLFFCNYINYGVFAQVITAGIVMIIYCYILNMYVVKNQEIISIISKIISKLRKT